MCRSPHHSSEQKGSKASKKVLFSALTDSFSVRFLAYYLHFAPFCLSSLVAGSSFSKPKYPLFTPKNPFLNGHFAPFSHIFNHSRGLYLYFSSAYLYFLARI